MKTFLDIWKPKIKIPKYIRDKAKKVNESDFVLGLEVDVMGFGGDRCVVMSIPRISWHNDAHVNEWGCLFVIRNDSGSYIQAKGNDPQIDQPVGTAAILQISRSHRLWCQEKRPKTQLWVALSWDMEEQPTREDCEGMIYHALI
jgi:hypothetical protein